MICRNVLTQREVMDIALKTVQTMCGQEVCSQRPEAGGRGRDFGKHLNILKSVLCSLEEEQRLSIWVIVHGFWIYLNTCYLQS